MDWLVTSDSTTVRAHQHTAAKEGSKDKVSDAPTNSREEHAAMYVPAGSTKPLSAPHRRRSCFHRLTQWRGTATRYEQHPDRYFAAITLASTLIWLDQ